MSNCNQCGFYHKSLIKAVCPHCGIFLYSDHNCELEKCKTWNCPKRKDQIIYHIFEYYADVRKDGSLDFDNKKPLCEAPARFYMDKNRKFYLEKLKLVDPDVLPKMEKKKPVVKASRKINGIDVMRKRNVKVSKYDLVDDDGKEIKEIKTVESKLDEKTQIVEEDEQSESDNESTEEEVEPEVVELPEEEEVEYKEEVDDWDEEFELLDET